MQLEKDVDSIRQNEKEIKENYLDRFERVFKEFTDLKVSLTQIQGMVERQEQHCRLIQEQKKK